MITAAHTLIRALDERAWKTATDDAALLADVAALRDVVERFAAGGRAFDGRDLELLETLGGSSEAQEPVHGEAGTSPRDALRAAARVTAILIAGSRARAEQRLPGRLSVALAYG